MSLQLIIAKDGLYQQVKRQVTDTGETILVEEGKTTYPNELIPFGAPLCVRAETYLSSFSPSAAHRLATIALLPAALSTAEAYATRIGATHVLFNSEPGIKFIGLDNKYELLGTAQAYIRHPLGGG